MASPRNRDPGQVVYPIPEPDCLVVPAPAPSPEVLAYMASAGANIKPPSLAKIVSGGQAGVDRGALDGALAAGFPAGGWCPEGREAEDGPIPSHYPLIELPNAGYRERTRKNVVDSDGTLVIYFGELSGGTAATVKHCEQLQKPVVVVNGDTLNAADAAGQAAAFIAAHSIAVLNVAGPRESKHAGARDFSRSVVSILIASRQ